MPSMLVASACTTGAERAGPTEGGTKAVATPTNRASTSFVMIWPRRKLKAGLRGGVWEGNSVNSGVGSSGGSAGGAVTCSGVGPSYSLV